MLRHWLFMLAAAWLMGCAVTVLVAWCCAVEGATLGKREVIESLQWLMPPLDGWPTQPAFADRWTNDAIFHGFDFSSMSASAESRLTTYDMYVARFGWPRASMYLPRYEQRELSYTAINAPSVIDGPGIEIAPHRIGGSASERPYHLKLPILPLWPGFLINSAIAAILLLAFAQLLRCGATRGTPRHRRRAHARWISLALSIGILASIAVSLGPWAYGKLRTTFYVNSDGPMFRMQTLARDGIDRGLDWPTSPPLGWPTHSTHLSRFREEWGIRFHVYNQGYFSSDSSDPDFDPYSAIVIQAGWPMPCLEAIDFVETKRDGSWVRTTRSLVVPVPTRTDLASSRHAQAPVPLTPIWLGLAANTLLYGYLIAMPLLTIRAIRVTRRRRRGACESCGYSRGGLSNDVACPECGEFGPNQRIRDLDRPIN